MTINELISYLSTLDGNLEVYIQGYEGGYSDILEENIEAIEVCRDFYKPDGNYWMGDHETSHAVGRVEYTSKYDIKKGIVFNR